MNRLEGRIAVVTGAARGIGRGIAQRFLEEGASVLLVDLLADVLAETASEFDEHSNRAGTFAADLTAPEAPRNIRESAETTFGPVDILVNNAGIGMGGRIDEFSDDEWNRVLAINLTAPFRLSREIVPGMAARGHGRVINISSYSGQNGMREDTAYAVSKAGIEALTRSIAVDYGVSGVTCNAIAPGVIGTPLMHSVFDRLDPQAPIISICLTNKPVPGEGKPADIAAAAAFLASDESRYVTGHVMPVDGGASTTAWVPEPEHAKVQRYVE